MFKLLSDAIVPRIDFFLPIKYEKLFEKAPLVCNIKQIIFGSKKEGIKKGRLNGFLDHYWEELKDKCHNTHIVSCLCSSIVSCVYGYVCLIKLC